MTCRRYTENRKSVAADPAFRRVEVLVNVAGKTDRGNLSNTTARAAAFLAPGGPRDDCRRGD